MQIRINSEKRELKSHGSFGFPVYISCKKLSNYERGAFAWHWHPEIELTLILSGRIVYQVNDRIYELCEGQGLFCNTNALHAGHMADGEDCEYLSVTFHPRMIYGFENSVIQRELVDPILRNQALGAVMFEGREAWEQEILRAMREIETAHGGADFPLRIQELLLRIWRHLAVSGCSGHTQQNAVTQGRDVERIRKVLDYLHSHYAERITLEQIAEQMNLCRSESCRFFKKYMKQSVFDYLLSYRIEKSIGLLAGTEESVTDIALKCGFSSPAYFTKIFKQQMQCTPMHYRKKYMSGQ